MSHKQMPSLPGRHFSIAKYREREYNTGDPIKRIKGDCL